MGGDNKTLHGQFEWQQSDMFPRMQDSKPAIQLAIAATSAGKVLISGSVLTQSVTPIPNAVHHNNQLLYSYWSFIFIIQVVLQK